MALNVTGALRKALSHLEREKAGIDRQIRAVQSALAALAGRKIPAPTGLRSRPTPQHRRMSAAARRKIGLRMKAYWAKRKAAAPEGKTKAPQKGK
ncbi:MAG: hypothetical protein ABSD47_16040 [Candidatus Methylomirabilota bacterium]|jgi:hypothetical protein